MRYSSIFLLLLSLPLWAQEREFKKIGKPEDKSEDAEKVETFTPTLEGKDKVIFSAIEPPKVFASCMTTKELEGDVAKRFQTEKRAPKLGKSGDSTVPTLEFWMEGKSDAPDSFSGMSIPDDMLAFALQMRVTETADRKPVTILEGRSVWWGAPGECGGGVKQATTALLDRFFEAYRVANPSKAKK